MSDAEVLVWIARAEESLAGAESEFAAGRYNNCANRCYCACFHAAIAALVRDGIVSAGDHSQWPHSFVQAQFAGVLIGRRTRYPAAL